MDSDAWINTAGLVLILLLIDRTTFDSTLLGTVVGWFRSTPLALATVGMTLSAGAGLLIGWARWGR